MLKQTKLSMISFFLLVLVFISACASPNASSPNNSANHNDSDSSVSSTPSSERTELTISAAASLTDVLEELQPRFETAHPSIKLSFNFGGSGSLQQQIEQGAPADLFLSAAEKNMQALIDKGLMDTENTTTLLTNELVLITSSSNELPISSEQDLTAEDIKIVALGIPESVPAGSYAREALTSLGLYEQLQPKIVQAKDVRQVLQYVETGNADAGFVYKTDALTSSKVKIVHTVDPSSYTAITYPVGVVLDSAHPEAAKAVYDFLQSSEAQAVFTKYGFSVPE
ncbi:molybdate ABC transporter substrate-binding protein [Paenibacillus urinalis]|uniref:Molybdate ABC transporter substrate-binding protein n=1 Tax=Paenibacillus urinalis TaxID=521520 RepID=A0AAX3MVG5_9BACL|nr:molybdate ABC transporter substrate-binding protein [Paenibacillus urinalis]WDH81403.1 molybdate ABC transporter substrate-binding protein [Paenibacillus urinalis]